MTESASHTILVIDDEAGIREYVFQILTKAGHRVVEAPDGESGLRVLRQSGVELVLVDVVMPGRDGFEIIEQLKHENPNVPIVVMSGDLNSALYLVIARKLGVTQTLSKPFTRQELLAAVAHALEEPRALKGSC
jgi:DNA-binding NtrC family response regulator